MPGGGVWVQVDAECRLEQGAALIGTGSRGQADVGMGM